MRWIRVCLLAMALSGCNLIGPDDPLDDERDRLERNAELWAANTPAHYSFVMQRVCFCGTEVTNRVRIEVRNGTVVARTYEEGGQPVGANFTNLFPNIEGVFQILRDALDRHAASFEAQYDSGRGYPLSAVIDYVANAVDEELSLRITTFIID